MHPIPGNKLLVLKKNQLFTFIFFIYNLYLYF